MLSSKLDMDLEPSQSRLGVIGSGLHKKTLVFFTILILLASLLSVVAVYHHNRGEAILNTIAFTDGEPIAGRSPANLGNEALARTHVALEYGLTVMTLVLAGILILFMVFFVRNIIQPLDKLEKFSRDMADGRLDRLVSDSENAGCSIGAIGENVNSLAMNLQEVLLLVWNLSDHNLGIVEETIKTLEKPQGVSREQILERLELIRAELEQMQDLTSQFEFFDVTLRGKMALAKDDAGKS